MSTNFAKYIYFKFLFIILLVVFKVSSVSSAPTDSNIQLLNNFVEYLKHATSCQFPEGIDFPFETKHDESNPWKFLSAPLQICNNVSNDDTKVHFILCSEVFDVLTNLSCRLKPKDMPHIHVEMPLDKPICEHLSQKKEVFVDKKEYIGKKLATDSSLCKMICTGEKIDPACRFLLWSSEVEKQIVDYEKNVNAAKNLSASDVIADVKNSTRLDGDTSSTLQDITQDVKTSLPVLPINSSGTSLSTVGNQSIIKPVPAITNLQPGSETIKADANPMQKDSQKDKNIIEKHPEPNNGAIPVTDVNENHPDQNQPLGKEIDNSITSDHNSDATAKLTTHDKATTHNINTTVIQSTSNTSMKISPEDAIKTDDEIPHEDPADNEIEDIDPKQKPEENSIVSKVLKENEKNSKSKNSIPNEEPDQIKNDHVPKKQKEEDENSFMIEIPKKSDNLLPGNGEDAVKDDNGVDEEPEYPKNNPDIQDVSNALPSESPEDLYVEKTDSAVLPGIKQDPFNKVEDRPEVLLNRDQDQSMDMENMERDFMGEFPSMEDGHSVNLNQHTFQDQDDSHFFFYFLSIIFMIMAGYLIFHNKQKIIALIVEGRHERRRRSHGASYKKLDTK